MDQVDWEPIVCQLCEQDDPWLHDHCAKCCQRLVDWYALVHHLRHPKEVSDVPIQDE